MRRLAFDIGSNSVGSAWIDDETGEIVTGISIFPAGVAESDEKRGDPKNVERRNMRRARITLARRAARKRELRLLLIGRGLLPPTEDQFRSLLSGTDPWELRVKALDGPLSPFEFGRILLHLAQRRGALGLKDPDPNDATAKDDGEVKKAIGEVRQKMLERRARTFGEFLAMVRRERVTALRSPDLRPAKKRLGPREYREAIRNRAARYEHCADRAMIRHEFAALWDAQRGFAGSLAGKLTDDLRLLLDDESGDAVWRHKGFLFGQRRQTWNVGALGRCVLEPTERCVPHADMYASRFLVVETVNNLRVIEQGCEPRALTPEERSRLKSYLSGPLGKVKSRNKASAEDKEKTGVTVTDLRTVMGWGRATQRSQYRFNIEADSDRVINTDWFSREIICSAIGEERWNQLSERIRDGINRAILRYDTEDEGDAEQLKKGLTGWAGLPEPAAEAVVGAWRRRPNLESKCLKMSRRAVRNLLAVMDRPEPYLEPEPSRGVRWLTVIEARKLIASDESFLDKTTGKPLEARTRERYRTGAKGATARDRYYMRKHQLSRRGKPLCSPDGAPLSEPPPAPLISNPVVRKAIHEVRRHLVAYLLRFGRKPDRIHIELAREARLGAKDADRLLRMNRLRNRIKRSIIEELLPDGHSSTQQDAAFTRVVLAVQQGGVCPLCGNTTVSTVLTPQIAQAGTDCEVAHIVPRGCGGDDGWHNIVLAHRKCNRDMDRRTPRQFWDASLTGGFKEGMGWVEQIFGNVQRVAGKMTESATGPALWLGYFTRRDDHRKIAQFEKSVTDIQAMTPAQLAATTYATRQVMTYLADAVFDGGGLPERGGTRRIFTSTGMWTDRLRKEWEMYFDTHSARMKTLDEEERRRRKAKNRADHRHHAIDAILIALCTPELQQQWEARERTAERVLPNSADIEAMANYRSRHQLPPPAPFKSVEEFRKAARFAVFGPQGSERPISHRPVKRKLIGSLHEAILNGPILDQRGNPTDYFVSRKSILDLKPKHLRMPTDESIDDAIRRLAKQRQQVVQCTASEAKRWAKEFVEQPTYRPRQEDPKPGKTAIVREVSLRRRIRDCLEENGVDPESFTKGDIKRLADAGLIRHASGVPIRTVALLKVMKDPVVVPRRRQDYSTGRVTTDPNPRSVRAYQGGNNHHIEIREDAKGVLTGQVVTAFEAAQRKLRRLQAFRSAAIPKPAAMRALTRKQRAELKPLIRQIEADHPIVDRRANGRLGQRFVMSLCEGETLWIREKHPDGEIGAASYFVVAKIDKPQGVWLVPHWDARAANGRKDSDGEIPLHSKRHTFSITPSDLKTLAPDGERTAVKVLVSPLGDIKKVAGD